MTDIEGASVNGNGDALEPVSETSAPIDSEPAAETTPGDIVDATQDQAPSADPVPASAPAAQLSFESSEGESPVEVVAESPESEMPEDLRALTESLEQPTGEMAAVVAETPDAATEAGASAIAEGESATAEGTAESESVTAEGESATAEGTTEGAESLDDIAPGTVAAEAAEPVAEATLEEVEAPRTTVSWWPFVAYIVLWLAAAAYAVWQLQQLPVGTAAYETNLYTMTMLGGLILLALGPLLLLIVWFASWIGRKGARIGLMFISALLKGAVATLIGAIIWIGALLLVDYLRLGRPF